MDARDPETYRRVAEAAWAWVQSEVRWTDGAWIPESATTPPATEVPAYRDGMHSGLGGLAHVLAEVRLAREWTGPERDLARAIADRVTSAMATEHDVTYFDGLSSTIGVLVALGAERAAEMAVEGAAERAAERAAEGADRALERAVDRLTELATADGWPQQTVGGPRYAEGARVNDLTLGTAGVLVGALWAARHGVDRGRALAERAAAVLLAEAEPVPAGLTWRFVPARFHVGEGVEMPNLSHGLAGIAAALAAAGVDLDRPDLVAAAQSGAEHLVTLGDRSDGGFVVPRTIPHTDPETDVVTYTWCHGPTGTASAFAALARAGVAEVAGEPPAAWHRRCLHSVRTSGLPERLYPGFWDNDGRCCGTAGVGDVFLDSWQRGRDPDDLAFAVELADVLVDRAVWDGAHAYWRFVEHRADPPLLPPGVGWMQGAAGISAYLFRVSRVVSDPAGAAAVARMDTWWSLPPTPRRNEATCRRH